MATSEAPEDRVSEDPEGAPLTRSLGCGCQPAMRDNETAGKEPGDWTETNSLETHEIDDGERTLLFDGNHPTDAVDNGRWIASPTTEVER